MNKVHSCVTQEAGLEIGVLLFWFWLILSSTILLNMLIAIISEAFVAIVNEDEENAGKPTMFDAIKDLAFFKVRRKWSFGPMHAV